MEDQRALANVPPLNVPLSWTDLFLIVPRDGWCRTWSVWKTLMMLQTSKIIAARIIALQLPAGVKVRSLSYDGVGSILLTRLNNYALRQSRLNSLLAFALQKKVTIVALDLAKLGLGWSRYDEIGAVLCACESIVEVDLSSNPLLEFHAAPLLPLLLANAAGVETLKLRYTELTVDSLGAWEVMLPQFLKLSHLDISCNDLDDWRAGGILERTLPLCLALKSLCLASCFLADQGVKCVAAALPSCPKLEILSLDDNFISDIGAFALAEVLALCPNIKELHLAYNKLSVQGAGDLCTNWPEAATPSSFLDLQYNNIEEDEFWEFKNVYLKYNDNKIEVRLASNEYEAKVNQNFLDFQMALFQRRVRIDCAWRRAVDIDLDICNIPNTWSKLPVNQ